MPFFEERGIPTPRLDAELLLSHVLDCSRMALYLEFDRPVNLGELEKFRPLVRQRGERVPVSYLTGNCAFWSLDLAVGPGCLIPRPDTEALVEAALGAVREIRAAEQSRPGTGATAMAVLELGTGTGAIPLALCSELENLRILSCDASKDAMRYAATNRNFHEGILTPRHNRLDLLLGDKFEALGPDFQPSLILSNPPYIPRDGIAGLEPEVAREEPSAALDGGIDGLDMIEYLLNFAAQRLPRSGQLVMEIGFDQRGAITRLCQAHESLDPPQFHQDLAGNDRVAQLRHR